MIIFEKTTVSYSISTVLIFIQKLFQLRGKQKLHITRREASRCWIPFRGAKRRANAATSNRPPTLYPRPQAGGLLIRAPDELITA